MGGHVPPRRHPGHSRPVTGRGNGLGNLVVIDLDTHKHPQAAAWWNSILWEHNGGSELKTWTQTTGGGGRQIFVRAPASWRAPTNRTTAGVDIRGQSGFAVLPPSLHDSGREYAWDRGLAPYDGLDILDAPDWLLNAIDEFIEQHGGARGEAHERVPGPGGDIDAFGNIIDGREEYMRDVVWAAVCDWRRECPIKPPEFEWPERMELAYLNYENHCKTRFSDLDKRKGLEREDRGPSLFRQKWRRAMKQWDGKVAEAAKERPFEEAKAAAVPPIPENAAPPKADGDGKPLPLILTAEQFIAGFTPPDYLIDGMMQRGYLYSLTARTGHGKTAVGMYLAQCIARSNRAPSSTWPAKTQTTSGHAFSCLPTAMASPRLTCRSISSPAWSTSRRVCPPSVKGRPRSLTS
jgi:hypothetical protein